MNVQFSAELVEDLRRELAKLEKAQLEGLAGIDRGYRLRGGVRTDEVCYRVFLEGPKIAAGRLHRRKDIATILGYPPAEVDVIELADFDFPRAGVPRREGRPDPAAAKPQNPIQPGISVSHFGQGAGTLGQIVYRKETGEPAILSCAHVIAGQFARRNDPVFQPALLDGGDPDFDAVGYLYDWFVNVDGDAAIAVLNRSRMINAAQLATAQKLQSAAPVRLGDLVEKSGRGSGLTHAVVDGIGLYRLTLAGFGAAWISGFRLVPRGDGRDEISRPGDSGAVWYRVNGSTDGVGLHIDGETPRGNGSRQPEYAIACHLTTVLDRLGVTMSPPVKAPVTRPGDATQKGDALVPAWHAELRTKLEEALAVLAKAAGGAGKDAPGQGSRAGSPPPEQPYPAAPVHQGGPPATIPAATRPAVDSAWAGALYDLLQQGALAALAGAGSNGSANGGEGKAQAPRHP